MGDLLTIGASPGFKPSGAKPGPAAHRAFPGAGFSTPRLTDRSSGRPSAPSWGRASAFVAASERLTRG